jgi:hydrogenase expression/formation protein HypC
MCLAIPGQIVEIVDEQLQLAKVEVGGVRRTINISLVHNDEQKISIGDWVLIHVGFALSRVDEAEAQSTLQALAEIGAAYQQELEEIHESRIT